MELAVNASVYTGVNVSLAMLFVSAVVFVQEERIKMPSNSKRNLKEFLIVFMAALNNG